MKQADEALKTMREVQDQIQQAIEKLGTIDALETFGDGSLQFDFTQSIYDLMSAHVRLKRAIDGVEKNEL